MQLMDGLLRIYGGHSQQYLNFYGPARTIKTVPFDLLLTANGDPAVAASLRNAVLLVGLSEIIPSEQRDAFYTVFSQNGVDMPGVEIAATAVANMIDGKWLTPLPFPVFICIIIGWGIITGMTCTGVRPTRMILITLILGLAYLAGAYAFFALKGTWVPLAIPLFIQIPVMIIIASIWHALDNRLQQGMLRSALVQYLPEQVVDQLIGSMGGTAIASREVHGVCLYSDIASYTTLSETLAPAELAARLNSYFEVLIDQIKSHGGVIANIVGDSLLAMWVTPADDPATRLAACTCAQNIQRTIANLKATGVPHALPTRIGLHVGSIHLGQIGAAGHFEYRPIGDIVNTATRLEGLNKLVGTTILASAEVTAGLPDLATRGLGRFVFVGKGMALSIHEIPHDRELPPEIASLFEQATAAYAGGELQLAETLLVNIMQSHPNDGPTNFYLQKCKQALENPVSGDWTGEFSLQVK
jgi:adenylate cyclase